jgi:hypothetical protein
MNLSAPTQLVFLIAVVIAVVAALAGFGIVAIPWVSANALLTSLIGFIVLALGCLLKDF